MLRQAFLSLLLLLAFLVQACGFRPLYQDKSLDLSRIHITIIPERIGQKLRTLLFQRFYALHPPDDFLYRLTIEPLHLQSTTLAIQPNTIPTRYLLSITARYTLSSLTQDNLLFSETYTASTAYTLSNQPFVNYTTKNNAIDRILHDLQHDITSSISLWLQSHTSLSHENQTLPNTHHR